MISILNLEKSFNKNPVLNNLKVEFQSGSIAGVVGRNGAGKTTLFQCIAGLESYAGNINASHPELKNHLAYLPTSPYMLSRITGREYIQLILNARGQKLVDVDQRNIFDLPLDRYSEYYSTGMKKKLALTAILMLENEYYIFDEPFSGVDLESNIIIKSIILKLKSLGKTIVISSHIYTALIEICDVIHLLDRGVISKSILADNFDEIESVLEGVSVTEIVNRLQLK